MNSSFSLQSFPLSFISLSIFVLLSLRFRSPILFLDFNFHSVIYSIYKCSLLLFPYRTYNSYVNLYILMVIPRLISFYVSHLYTLSQVSVLISFFTFFIVLLQISRFL